MSQRTQRGCRQFMSNHEKLSCVHSPFLLFLLSSFISFLPNSCDLIEELEDYRKDYCLCRLRENQHKQLASSIGICYKKS